MAKYEHIIPKNGQQGFAQDPPQDVPNSSGGLLDRPLTAQNAVVIGTGVMYGKKILTKGFNTVLNQTGNYKYERYVEIGTKIATYAAIGIASGPAAVVTVPAAIATDIVLKAIDDGVKGHELNLANERLVQERGVRRKFGVDIYD